MLEKTLDVWNGNTGPWACTQYNGHGASLIWNYPTHGINQWIYNNDPVTYGYMKKPGIRLSDARDVGSVHTGGCHILMADGAVRFVSENLNRATGRLLVLIADNATIGEF